MESNCSGPWAIVLLQSDHPSVRYPCRNYDEVLRLAEKYMENNQPKKGERIGIIAGIVDGGKEHVD